MPQGLGVQDVEREHTTALEQISRIRDFSVRDLRLIADDYTTKVRNATLAFVRCDLSLLTTPELL